MSDDSVLKIVVPVTVDSSAVLRRNGEAKAADEDDAAVVYAIK